MSTTIKFEDVKSKLLKALEERGTSLGIKEGVTLVNGFISQPIMDEVKGAFVIGGPTIPMIAVVGNNSGRIYFFALKALLPDINER